MILSIPCNVLPKLQLPQNEKGQNPILTYGEWAIIPFYIEIVVMNLIGSSPRHLATLKEKGHFYTKIVIIPVTNQPPFLVAGTHDGVIFIYQSDGRQFPRIHVLNGHTDLISCLAASTRSNKPQTPDYRGLFISGSYDGTVRLWSAITGECLKLYQGEELF